MTMRYLVPVLDSVNALPAVRYIVRESLNGERAQVRLLQTRARASDLEAPRALLERFKIRYHVERAAAAGRFEAIVQAAQRPDIDAVVLGTARYRSVTRMSEDSVVSKLLDCCPAPLFVVQGKDVSPLERYGIAAGLGATLGLILFA
jgi:nucleotide-binding universal stress UspA family protein